MGWQGAPAVRSEREASEILEYPRLLFLTSSAFNKITGGGVTFSSLFAGWPKDRIATVHNDRVPVTRDVCEEYYHLSSKEIGKSGLLRVLNGRAGSGGASQTFSAPRRNGGTSKGLRALRGLIFGDALPERATLTAELSAWIAAFQPQLLYTILGSNSMMELTESIRRRFGLPLAIHIMDDWPETLYRRGWLGHWQRKRMETLFDVLLHAASVRMAICPQMSEAYGARYGLPFRDFQNAIDVDRWGKYAKRDLSVGDEIRLLYVGSIYPNAQLESLCDCCRAVSTLRQQGMPVTLHIHSPSFLAEPFRQRLLVSPAVVLHDALSDDEEFFTELARADALVLPVNFDEATVRYIRYSMPTKVPAYLVSGTPVLVYGPDAVAQVRYAQEAGWGHVIARESTEAVMEGIKEIVKNSQLRVRVSARAQALARENHDINDIRARFQGTLREAVGAS